MEDFSRRPVVVPPPGESSSSDSFRNGEYDLEPYTAKLRFREFFRNYRQGNMFIYREALLRQHARREYFVEVDLFHINEFDSVLYDNIQVCIC